MVGQALTYDAGCRRANVALTTEGQTCRVGTAEQHVETVRGLGCVE